MYIKGGLSGEEREALAAGVAGLPPDLHPPRWGTGRDAAKAEDAQGTPTQNHISPSILVNEEK